MTGPLDRVDPLPYPSKVDAVALPSGPIDLWRPPKAEELLKEMIDGPFDPDEKLPYWADLWPAAVGLAIAVDDGTVPVRPGQAWLELGCGLGLVALAAARRGAQVTATDWIPAALRYVAASAELNGLSVVTRRVDWRDPPSDLAPTRIVAADVLYEARNGPWLAALLDRWRTPGVEVWISDPGRAHAAAFFDALKGWATTRRELPIESPHVPTGRARLILHRLTPA